MKRKTYHVTRGTAGWRVIRADAKRPTNVLRRKVDAVERAKVLAKRFSRGQVKVHGVDGKLQAEYTYGKDPRRFRG